MISFARVLTLSQSSCLVKELGAPRPSFEIALFWLEIVWEIDAPLKTSLNVFLVSKLKELGVPFPSLTSCHQCWTYSFARESSFKIILLVGLALLLEFLPMMMTIVFRGDFVPLRNLLPSAKCMYNIRSFSGSALLGL